MPLFITQIQYSIFGKTVKSVLLDFSITTTKGKKSEFQIFIATNVATTESRYKNSRFYAVYETAAGDSGCVLGFSCCARKAQHRVLVPNTACRRTLTPMPPAGGGLTVELWHKSETHIGAAICSAAWGTPCRRAMLQAVRASVQACATQTPRPPTVAA